MLSKGEVVSEISFSPAEIRKMAWWGGDGDRASRSWSATGRLAASAQALANSSLDDAPSQGCVVDPEQIEALRRIPADGGGTLLEQLISMFLGQLDSNLRHVRRAIARVDAVAMRRDAHRLKGSASVFGARRVMACCESLELLASTQRLADACALMGRLEVEAIALKAALEDKKAAASGRN
jgi:HPt (histidine-containing phosphotransfer) domain-containing protein